ncbi:MAG: hypothetical protein HZB38_08025 [Planctomycetes bacterium]|nr:hypothetical protein [Planctomycetota bacterium]
MATKTNSYEKQAVLSVAAASIGILAVLGALTLILRSFKWTEFTVTMGAQGKAYPLTLGCILLACLAGGIGALAGFVSAGQRRNSKSGVSWMGFFLSAGVIALALSTFLFFWFSKEIVQRA